MDVETRAPQHLLHACSRTGTSCVEDCLDIGKIRFCRRIRVLCHNAIAPLRHGRDHERACFGEIERHLVTDDRPLHPHVGEHEGAVGLARKADLARVANGASHPVGSDKIAAVEADLIASPVECDPEAVTRPVETT
jgi:hypothetical protein